MFALLACNTGVYVFRGTSSEALDAAAWLALLGLFELEAASNNRFRSRGAATAIRGARVAAAAAVGAAAIGYVNEREWLNAVNIGLWIAVVVLLEFEIRSPRAVTRHRLWFTSTAVLLYSSLAVLVLAWGWRGEWLDAYDALLWLAAFAMIEMDVLRISRKEAAV